jgi:CDP-alcohol phosphatidyltransferase
LKMLGRLSDFSEVELSLPMPNSPPRTPNGSLKKRSVPTPTSSRQANLNPLIHHNNVFLFIPNIIGYTRVFLAACSLYFMRWHPKYCTWLYIVSCLLDAFDGMAARRFKQGARSRSLGSADL